MSGTLSVWMQFVGVVKSKSMGDGPTFMAETGSLTAIGEVDARLPTRDGRICCPFCVEGMTKETWPLARTTLGRCAAASLYT
jgi:hypothetical protein